MHAAENENDPPVYLPPDSPFISITLTARRPDLGPCAAFTILLGQLALAVPAHGQLAGPPPAAIPESTTVIAGPDYAAGGLHRWLFGKHYRTLWTTPIRVEVLDLGTFAGGLTPLNQGGGLQTQVLRFSGADGKEYAFRSVNKDASKLLPPDLRETFAARVAQDQVSAAHPAGVVVAARLAGAAGVRHSDPTLVYLPDDPRLGEFRSEFAGVVGFIEEQPDDNKDPSVTLAGALDIVSTDSLYKIIEMKEGNYVDSEQFLRARLLDLFLGDWDRPRDRWRWAKVTDGDGFLWVPIPRDRDQAFVLFDGAPPRVRAPEFSATAQVRPQVRPRPRRHLEWPRPRSPVPGAAVAVDVGLDGRIARIGADR